MNEDDEYLRFLAKFVFTDDFFKVVEPLVNIADSEKYHNLQDQLSNVIGEYLNIESILVVSNLLVNLLRDYKFLERINQDKNYRNNLGTNI